MRDVVDPSQQAAATIAGVGGLPEITDAAANLVLAFEQTRQEIETADFASRFLRVPSDHFLAMVDNARLSHEAVEAIAMEGEAGMKRSELRADLAAIEGGLTSLIRRFVELRADLCFAQEEF